MESALENILISGYKDDMISFLKIAQITMMKQFNSPYQITSLLPGDQHGYCLAAWKTMIKD